MCAGWLGRHKRFHMHFTPTSASWLNMIERFFQGSDLQPRAPWCLPQRAREPLERGLVEVACWAQSRRKSYQARWSHWQGATTALAFIGLLYKIERGAKDLGREDRFALRQRFAVPVREHFKQ